MSVVTIRNLEELKKFSQEIIQEFKQPQLILLEGPLGAGKTQFIQFACEFLGVPKEEICSPSFSIINDYSASNYHISHIDLFRLKNQEDLESTGIWDVFLNHQIIFIEWSNLCKEAWPSQWNQIHLSFEFLQDKNLRQIKWKKN